MAPRSLAGDDKEGDETVDVKLALTGDVMIGRGVDQVQRHHVSPELYEGFIGSAIDYVALAEQRSGPIRRGVDPAYPWGDALRALTDADVCVVNLETALTTHDRPADKGIHYRAHPANVAVLGVAGVDVAVVANNHVLDWGVPGLLETLDVLDRAALRRPGAGRDDVEAWAPVTAGLPGGRRLHVLSAATWSSGVDASWAAAPGRPGVALLPDLSAATARRVAARARAGFRTGDLVLVSLHWGGNWGWDVPSEHRAFARALVDAGVHVVHGHSSHHPLGVEVHRGQPVLYGCGDLLNDYEGIGCGDAYRADLVAVWQVALRADGALAALRAVPFRVRRFRLERASPDDLMWLEGTLGRECGRLGTRLIRQDGALALRW